jgi:hypothetical protein
MKLASSYRAPPGYFDGLANELEAIALAINARPQFNTHFADRLKELASEMREDIAYIAGAARPN